MTYKHECNNCRWALMKYTGPICTNSKSGRNNVNERDGVCGGRRCQTMRIGLQECHDSRPCFGRNDKGLCKVLAETYEGNRCPFCKSDRIETQGRMYPDAERNRSMKL